MSPFKSQFFTECKFMKKILSLNSLIFFGLCFIYSSLQAQESVSVSTKSLTGPMAMKLVMKTYNDCTKKGYNVAVAVVNREGRLIAFVRNPLSGIHAIEVSQGKAYTAATFKSSTAKLAGRDFMRDIPGALIWGGGLPINIGGNFYGGIGVAGAPAKEVPGDVDDECAQAGLNAIAEEIEFGE
jgi:uncharacterized protein GlcG (DUF336 family)